MNQLHFRRVGRQRHMSRRLPRSLVHGQCFTFSEQLSKICGTDAQPQRLPMRSGKNRGRATRKTRSKSTVLVSSALLRPPSLTSLHRTIEDRSSARRHIAPASGHVKKGKQSQDLHFQIEVSVRDVGGVKAQCRNLSAAP